MALLTRHAAWLVTEQGSGARIFIAADHKP